MSANAMLAVLNILYTWEEYRRRWTACSRATAGLRNCKARFVVRNRGV